MTNPTREGAVPNADGTIYVLKAGPHVKIGWTQNLEERIKALRTGSPLPLTLVGTCSGTKARERALHREFISARTQGEWFALSDQQMATLAARLEGVPRVIRLPRATARKPRRWRR